MPLYVPFMCYNSQAVIMSNLCLKSFFYYLNLRFEQLQAILIPNTAIV